MSIARAWLVLATATLCTHAGPGPPPPPAPPFSFPRAHYNVTLPENSPPRSLATPLVGSPTPAIPLPHPNARVRFRIKHGDKDKFFKAEDRTIGDMCFLSIRTRAGHDVLNRERQSSYQLDVHATAILPNGRQLDAVTSVTVDVADVNDLSPLFYPTEYEAYVPEDAPEHSSVLRVSAEDADVGINGEIYYSIEDADGLFVIHPTTGVVTVTRRLSAATAARHDFSVLARDRASLLERHDKAPTARASVTIHVSPVNLHAPEMKVRRLPELFDDSPAVVYAIVEVTDRDAGENGRIASLDIVDGDPDGHFRVRPGAEAGEWEVAAHALLDRGGRAAYNLTLRARDAGRPPRSAYLALPVRPRRAGRDAPVFSRELYEASVPETAPPRTPIIRLKVGGREPPTARVYIEIVGGNEGGEFFVNPDTGVLYTAVELDAERRALYTLTVSAIDQGDVGARKQSSAKVKVTVLDANDNDPVFEHEELTVTVPENQPGGGVVARVTARDADSGENAYVSYSIVNLQPVPFDVEHFSGAVRATRVLDYESMRREYVLRVRASDWGLPYRRQAEMRLTVRLQDVNDNRPQFERVDCVGYLPRRLPIGTEVATLSAIDFDAGDVVSYRIIGGNEDNCFALDASTGVLTVACPLRSVAEDSRVLNVTATDGTHFADATALTLQLAGGGAAPALECRDTGAARRLAALLAAAERGNAPQDNDDFPDEPEHYRKNLHSPEFIDFPVEVKVNESVALGTSLVRLKARDRDLGYNGLIVFGISGGDDDSVFRIDQETGELKVIGYLDRERETEYYLNVTAYDLGTPRRSSSRLLPVTVLDVNDNPPRFQKTLASFRVTENALNGTAIFYANATDRDSGQFAKITYSLNGADGEFCIDPESGVLSVCAALDRERRELYELSIFATDGGGLSAEARVRVEVDDVNDNAPHFALTTYSARVREDLPPGTVVAVIEAFDPDLGASGKVTYSLPDQTPEDAVFTIDPLSGTLCTAKWLDYEERQVHGVTVRATDGGQPSLSAETSVVIEVDDVDENRHAPSFREPVLSASVSEAAVVGTRVITLLARDIDPPGRDSRLSYYILGGTGMRHFSIDDKGVIRTVSPLDRESAPHYWLTACAQDYGIVTKEACVEVYIEVENVEDISPWPESAYYEAVVREGAVGGTRVERVLCADGDADPVPKNITYSIVAGNPDGLFSIDEFTGLIVTTGRSIDREAASAHTLEVRCARSGGTLSSSVRVRVRISDVNDHAPVFTQRFYALKVRAALLAADIQNTVDAIEEGSAIESNEGADTDSDDDEALEWDVCEQAEPGDLYIATVLALDSDEAENGTVWYSARARAHGAVRVTVRGALYAPPHAQAQLSAGRTLDVTIRACDRGTPPRCSVSRASVSLLPRSPSSPSPPPSLAPAPPLQLAELDAPGFLLHVLQPLQPRTLFYHIVDGDPRQQFYVGHSDGNLIVARPLVSEEQHFYLLKLSATDGLHVVYQTINITVINDVNEGGVHFTQPLYTVDTSEDTRVGSVIAHVSAHVGHVTHAGHAHTQLLYGIQAARAPASMKLFEMRERTGEIVLASPLDRETAGIHELTIWARDIAPRASRNVTRLLIRVRDTDERAPEWRRALWDLRVPRGSVPGALLAPLAAVDRDATDTSVLYELVAGDPGGYFQVDSKLGELRISRPLDDSSTEFTLSVRATSSQGSAELPVHVLVTRAPDGKPHVRSGHVHADVREGQGGVYVASVHAESDSALWYELSNGEGRFRINPACGVITTTAPLNYEEKSLYNLTVTVTNMGGGSAEMYVTVHVIDVNEFAPVFSLPLYSASLPEDSSPPAAPLTPLLQPLVLSTSDEDGEGQRLKSFHIIEPEAREMFRIDEASGAVRLQGKLDYETTPVYNFTVRVQDAGDPRVTSHSLTRVTINVLDVDDEPPSFSQKEYQAVLYIPTAKDVRVLSVTASDPDSDTLHYDIIQGDEDHSFKLTSKGDLLVDDETSLTAGRRSLRIRVSDGSQSGTTRAILELRATPRAGLVFHKPDYYGSLLENSTKPVTIAVLDVLGAALNEHIEFTILNPTEGFEIGTTSGAVRSTGISLDREQCDSYTLLVQATSGGVASSVGGAGGGARVAQARLHVQVLDVNDNCPVFTSQPYIAAVLAGDPANTHVVTVHAVDADANDNGEVRYEMKRGEGELFRVDRASGVVSLKQTLEPRPKPYTLHVAAIDGGTPMCISETTVSVSVWGGGASPRWPHAAHVAHAREAATTRTPYTLATLQAISPLNRQLIYTIVSAVSDDQRNNDSKMLFDLNFETGTLVCVSPLDYESARTHTLTIRATDGVTGARADTVLTLHVLDDNDNAPRFQRVEYTAEVSEAAPKGYSVITVVATDEDSGENGQITYSLSSDNNATLSLFSIEPATGTVRVRAPLDRESCMSHLVLLTASDAGRPPRITTAMLLITVLDVNDNPPTLPSRAMTVRVSSSSSRGVRVGRVVAHDADIGSLTLSVIRAEPARASRVLALNNKSGVLSVNDPSVLPTDGAAWSLNVSISDGAHVRYMRVRILRAPDNSAPPAFPHVVHEARALENQPPNLRVTTVRAFDSDPGEFGAITYSIPSARLRETFALDARSGALTTRVPLDREERQEWEIPITASDGGGLIAHSTVRVRVVDDNDNAPVFPIRHYCVTTPTPITPTTSSAPLIKLTATDADVPPNNNITYSLRDDSKLFRIDARSGELFFANNVTEDVDGKTLQVWVVARDNGGLSSSVSVSVHIHPPPPRSPLPPSLFLPEDAPLGTLLAQLPPGVVYSIVEGENSDLFAVDDVGKLTLVGALDRETVAEHVIGVQSSLGGACWTEQTVLRVLDVNEFPPQLHSQPYVLHAAESTPPHAMLLQLMADDPDAGSNGEVRFELVSDEQLPFSLDPYTGWLTLNQPLDRESVSEYRVGVETRDSGAASSRRHARGSLVLRVRDYNDMPHAFLHTTYAAQVSEDASPGTLVARLEVHDADTGGASVLTYFIAEGDSSSRFSVRAVTNAAELLVARELDRETQESYNLTIVATDGKFSAETVVDVTVLDVNDNPPYCIVPRYSITLDEDASVGARVCTLGVRDADRPPHAACKYTLSGEHHDHFVIHEETGEITVVGELDRETVSEYELVAHAQDVDHPTWRCSSDVRITLRDVNDNTPRFSRNVYSVTLPEDAEPGTVLTKIHAIDEDLGDNRRLTYSIEEQGDPVFTLEQDTGIVTLRRALDRERSAAHSAALSVRDHGLPSRSSTAQLRLTVADVNDNPPEFEFRTYRASVSEATEIGFELLRVRAVSNDAGVNADVTYSLVSGDGKDDFTIDKHSGVVTVARALDFERRRQYALTLQALDGGEPALSDSAALLLSVLDENDNTPVFAQKSYTTRIREDAAPGTMLLQLIALDADDGANGRVAYSIVRGDRDGRFAVDSDTGHLSLSAPLDRELQQSHTLIVRARDSGTPPRDATVTVTVDVLDANDNPPVFSQSNYTGVVAEDRALGTIVLRMRVSDLDSPPNGAPFTWDLQGGNEAGGFRVEQDGTLRTAATFNHRVRSVYDLQVRVFDNGSPPLYSDTVVRVRIVARSQFPPAATPLDVALACREPCAATALGNVHASDKDAYDTLTYSLSVPNNAAGLFEIDSADGMLKASAGLDPGLYRLNVTVHDGKLYGHALVRVTVVVVSDDMLARAVVVRFREVTEKDFILAHRRGFVRAVSEAAGCEPDEVVLLSVQAGEEDATDLDVAVATPASAELLRRRLHAHLERVEERARLVVEQLPRAVCAACARAACRERVELIGNPRAISVDVYSLVAPAHRLRAHCVCTGDDNCEPEATDNVIQLAGDGYLMYKLRRGIEDEMTVTLRLRTTAARGTLLHVSGLVDYLTLEVFDGSVRVRLELGGGITTAETTVRIDDGAWHSVRLERRGSALRLSVDRRTERAHAPAGPAVLDAPPVLLVGGMLLRHQHADAPEQVTYGFDGCLSDLTLDGESLPLEENTEDGRAHLERSTALRRGCGVIGDAHACGAAPCQHGGSCIPNGNAYICRCHARYSGDHCEVDSDPCASRPCLNNGVCEAETGEWKCLCGAGLSGLRCELGQHCKPDACLHGGQCEEGEIGPTCRCRGYFGARCQLDVDECAGEPCLNGATCVNEPGSFRCLCPPDKTGMNCGNPLYSDAVVASGGINQTTLLDVWRWILGERWPLFVVGAIAILLLLLILVVVLVRRRTPVPLPPPAPKLSNLTAARRERPPSAGDPPAPLNNVDTLRSYGSAGDELEGIPPDYLRNLNIDADRKPWSEQMHLHSFVDNKIYNDLKNLKSNRITSPTTNRRLVGGGGELVGGYHWDCSDWCGAAPPGISEVARSERRDSSSASPRSPRRTRPHTDTDSTREDLDASSYLLNNDSWSRGECEAESEARGEAELRVRLPRQPDAASLITMLEERNSLLGAHSCSDLSTNLCEIEDSDEEDPPTPRAVTPTRTIHTDV